MSLLMWAGIAVAIAYLIYKYGKDIQNRIFANVCNKALQEYHEILRDMKKDHFDSLREHTSADPELKSMKALKILEIGAGSGVNFELYPANSHLSVVEPNEHFKKVFYENQHKHPEIKMDKFIVAGAEDMKDVEDNSIDVVVSTLVLCSVRDVAKVLKEIHRVLAPGGRFYYWEHVHDKKGSWLHFFQNLLDPIWLVVFDGCRINRNIDSMVNAEKGFSKVEQRRFYIPLKKGIWKMVRSHVMGIATK